MSDFVLPTVHLNGTGRETLAHGYHEAYRALIKFKEAFASIEFNARDYYVQGPGSWDRAVEQRDEQRQNIGELMQYLEKHLIELGE